MSRRKRSRSVAERRCAITQRGASHPLTGVEFIYLRHRAGFDRASVARFLGVSVRTIRRYEKHGAPRVVFLALALRAGDAPGWEGFRFRDGELLTPLGERIAQSEIANRQYLYYLEWLRGWESCEKSGIYQPPQQLRLVS